MTERVIGPTGSPRRRWTMLVPLTLAFVLGLMYITGAQAVHDVGVFQMDGNAQTSVQSSPTADEDWDLICKDNLSTCTFKNAGLIPAGNTTAVASSHEKDVLFSGTSAGTESLLATIFHGNSKDTAGIGTWRWNDGGGGLPDKDNLLHAYAARYSVTDENCASGGTEPESCEIIYFGSDRYANDGDATQAFWFLQNAVALNPEAKSNGGFEFTGGHKNGDLLIISEFSNGGTKSTITVYKWTCAVAATCDSTGGLTFVAGGEGQKCSPAVSIDPFCGIVNESATPTVSPWTFLDKGGSTDFRQGEFFEAGLNLSSPALNLAGECFSTFVAETRSSTSTTATLKDFVLGGFQQCTAGVTTAQNWLPNDSATVTIGGLTTWAGTVKFELYNTLNCTGTKLYEEDPKAVSNATPTVSTNTPAAQLVTATASRSWKVDFTPNAATLAAGVPDPDPVCESTALTINNNATIGP